MSLRLRPQRAHEAGRSQRGRRRGSKDFREGRDFCLVGGRPPDPNPVRRGPSRAGEGPPRSQGPHLPPRVPFPGAPTRPEAHGAHPGRPSPGRSTRGGTGPPRRPRGNGPPPTLPFPPPPFWPLAEEGGPGRAGEGRGGAGPGPGPGRAADGARADQRWPARLVNPSRRAPAPRKVRD